MRPIPLPSDNTLIDRNFQARLEPLAEDVAVVGEVAIRLIELREMNGDEWPVLLLRHLVAVSDSDSCKSRFGNIRHLPHYPGFWALIEAMTGDLSRITQPYREIGQARGTTKQNEQQNRQRALGRMAVKHPALAKALTDLHAHLKSKPATPEPEEETPDPDDIGIAEHLAPPVAAVAADDEAEEME